MQIGRCPVCHHRITLEAVIQDQASSELLAVLAGLDKSFSHAMIGYIALFRSPSRDLANDRALRLVDEVLAISDDRARLEKALLATANSLRAKTTKTLKNHNYLKRVFETTEADPPSTAIKPTQNQPKSKTARALSELEDLKNAK